MYWVVFSFSRDSRAGFAVNRHAVFREPQDFLLNPQVSRKESDVVDFVTGYLVQFND